MICFVHSFGYSFCNINGDKAIIIYEDYTLLEEIHNSILKENCVDFYNIHEINSQILKNYDIVILEMIFINDELSNEMKDFLNKSQFNNKKVFVCGIGGMDRTYINLQLKEYINIQSPYNIYFNSDEISEIEDVAYCIQKSIKYVINSMY